MFAPDKDSIEAEGGVLTALKDKTNNLPKRSLRKVISKCPNTTEDRSETTKEKKKTNPK